MEAAVIGAPLSAASRSGKSISQKESSDPLSDQKVNKCDIRDPKA